MKQSGLTAVIQEHVVALFATSLALGRRLVLDPLLTIIFPMLRPSSCPLRLHTWYAGGVSSSELAATLLGSGLPQSGFLSHRVFTRQLRAYLNKSVLSCKEPSV